MIITIDGPAGSGKSTAAKQAAKKLGYRFLNTGAMYRAITYLISEQSIALEDIPAIENLLHHAEIHFDGEAVLANGQDISRAIRMPEVERNVSAVSSLRCVRMKMTELQRKIVSEGRYVAEGRDMGTVVFPNANCKFFLQASPEVRAQRRLKEIQEKGLPEKSLEEVKEDIIRRDQLDSSRQLAPLRIPDGAIVLDTSGLTIEEVTDQIVDAVKNINPSLFF